MTIRYEITLSDCSILRAEACFAEPLERRRPSYHPRLAEYLGEEFFSPRRLDLRMRTVAEVLEAEIKISYDADWPEFFASSASHARRLSDPCLRTWESHSDHQTLAALSNSK